MQGAHELGGEPFTQRVFAGEFPEFGDEPVVLPERERRVDAVLGRGQPQLGEPGRARRVGEPVERGTPPERQRLGEEREFRFRPGGFPRLRGEPLEAVQVDVLRVDGEPVPGGGELDEPVRRAAVLEALAQPRDLGLQRLGGPLGRVVAVQAVDQPFGTDDPSGVEREQGEQAAQLRPAERDGCPIGTVGFDRPEDGELHTADSGPRTTRAARGARTFTAGRGRTRGCRPPAAPAPPARRSGHPWRTPTSARSSPPGP